MINLQFPPPDFRIKEEKGKHYVYDTIRNKWLVLTEEEWVRQNMVSYLIRLANCPRALIALEKGIKLNELKKRFDILVYDSSLRPWMLVECKAPEVGLSEDVLRQVLNYNITTPVKYIVITNGRATAAWEKCGARMLPLKDIPLWQPVSD